MTIEPARIAHLAGLDPVDASSDVHADELIRILEFAAALDSLHTGDQTREPVVGGASPLREDIPMPSLELEEALRNVSHRDAAWCVVQRIVPRDNACGLPGNDPSVTASSDDTSG